MEKQLEELGDASDRLECSIARMLALKSPRTEEARNRELELRLGEGDNLQRGEEDKSSPGGLDIRFDHSWTPAWTGPKWIWIPKGCLSLEQGFAARQEEIRRLGFLSRQVRVSPPPKPLDRSFAQAVRSEMANRNQRPPGKRRQEDGWMEEDDLLGGDLYHEQDLRAQLQGGGRFQGEMERNGSKGRRLEPTDGRGFEQGGREMERGRGGRVAGQGRQEPYRLGNQNRGWSSGYQGGGVQNQQGSWHQGSQAAWNRQDRRPSQDYKKEIQRDKGMAGSSADGLKPNANPEIKCYRCLQVGHHQYECSNEPVCYKCKMEGHIAADCKEVGGRN